jgi:hypothetical protein
MSKWKSWAVNVLAVIGAISLFFQVIKGGTELKEIFWTKPQISAIENCRVRPEGPEQQMEFELLVNNPDSKNVSIISVGLIWPDKHKAEIYKYKPELPMTIPAGQTIRIPVWGYCRELDVKKGVRDKLELSKNQNVLEGTVAVRFNTNDISKKKITFPLERQQ